MQNGNIIPTMPMAPATQQNDMFGNNWIWILLIFLFLGGGNFGRGNPLSGNEVAANSATNLINNDFLYTQQKVDALAQAVVNQTTSLNQTLCNGFGDVRMGLAENGFRTQQGLSELGFKQQQCCCDTLRAIDGVNYNASQNTCNITNTIRDEARLTRDLITANSMQDLRDRNVELAQALSNCNQSSMINASIHNAINTRFPYPVPASLVGYGYPGFPAGGIAPVGGFDGRCA